MKISIFPRSFIGTFISLLMILLSVGCSIPTNTVNNTTYIPTTIVSTSLIPTTVTETLIVPTTITATSTSVVYNTVVTTQKPPPPSTVFVEKTPDIWKTYANALFRCEIQYPSSWGLNAKNDYLSVDGPGITSIGFPQPYQWNSSLKVLVDRQISSDNNNETYRILSQNYFMWDVNSPACIWEDRIIYEKNSDTLSRKYFFLLTNGYFYQICCVALENEYKTYSPTFDTFIARFEVVNQ
jgi:hypothetical protein